MLYCTNEPMKLSMLVLTSFLTASIIHVSVLEAGGCSSSHYPLNIPPAQPVPSFDAQGNLMLENTTSTAPTSSTPPATQLPLCQTVDGASPLLRKEWRQLTAIEKNSFLDSIWALKRTETVNPEERHRRSNRYDDLVRSYAKGFKDYKGKPSFLPFIRRFLKRIELEMQEISGNISMTVPYWDWSIDSQAPERSSVFGNDSFGMYTSAPQDVQTLQQQQQNHRQNTFDFLNSRDCVHNGRFGVESNWTVSLVPNPDAKKKGFGKRCLKRSAGKAAVGTSLIPTEVLKTILKTSIDYNSLILHLMAGPFSIMPVEIGGDLASGTYSLNDPLFILHLAFIDKLWLEWEKLDGSSTRFVRGYEGIERRKWPHRDRIVSTNDLVVIEGSVSDVPVIHLLDPRNSYLCYDYSPGVVPSGRLLPDEIIPLPASNYLPPVKLSPADRTNPFYLRTPYPIPEKWSSRLRFHTEDSMNVMESRVAHVIQAVNRMISTGEHVSSSSLIFHSAATGSGGGGNMSSKSGFWEDTGFDASLT